MGRVPAGCIVGLVILGIGVLLSIVGIATVEWLTLGPNTIYGYQFYGLFKTCFNSECTDYQDLDDGNLITTSEYKAAIACVLMGIILSGLSFICNLGILLWSLKGGPITHRAPESLAFVFSLLGAPLLLAGAIIFVVHLVDLTNGTNFGLRYSLFLTIVGLILIFIGGITTYITTSRSHAQTGQVMSPGQTNIVVQNQMQTGAAYGQQQQQQYPLAAQQPYQWPNQQNPPAQPYPDVRKQDQGWY